MQAGPGHGVGFAVTCAPTRFNPAAMSSSDTSSHETEGSQSHVDAHGERMPVDKQVLVWRLELLLVAHTRSPEVAGLGDHTGAMTGGDVVVVGAVVHGRFPVYWL